MNQISKILLVMGVALTAAAESDVAKQRVIQEVQDQVEKDCSFCKVDIQFLNSTQKFEINENDKILAHHWKGQTEIHIYGAEKEIAVPVEIRWLDQVVVAERNIKQGDLISSDNIKVIEKDVTFNNKAYVRSMDAAVGLVSKRGLIRGQMIEEDLLKKPTVVRYGQVIKVEFVQNSLSLMMSGQAKGAGAVGDSIPVFIPHTKSNVYGEIMDQNTVRMK